jgi:protein TonB
MGPRPGFALCLFAACGIHAVILLVPRAAVGAEPPIPTVELDLAAAAAAQGGPAVTQAPARRAAAVRTVQETRAGPAEVAPTEPLRPAARTEPPVAAVWDTEPAATAVSVPESAGEPGSQASGAGPASGSDGASAASSAASPGGTKGGAGAGSGVAGTPAVAATGFVAPRLREDIFPEYPRSARRSGFEGLVKVAAAVDASGVVTTAEVVASSGHASLDQAALEAVRRALFAPALQEGTPVPCRVVIPVRFQLSAPAP